ncbi:MAG: 8-oxo-dGTP diphosphatase MutT [Firmicutes bacterium]|nr:8-oxo-dGTP diphosphatase MutT [Bacillota bacterium]
MLVTAAIIRDGSKVLLTQRKKGSHLSDKWEFPGGKMEAGESPEACLKRELKEEIGVEAKIGDIFKVVYYHYSRGPILLLAYWVEIDRTPEAIDCQALEWVEINTLDDTKFPPADLPVLNKLRYGTPLPVAEETSAPRGFKRLLGLFGDRG